MVAELASVTKCSHDACHWETFAFLISVDHGTGAESEVGEWTDSYFPVVDSALELYAVIGRATMPHLYESCFDRNLNR